MDVSIPDSLTGFIAQRVRSGGYPNADAFVADLLASEARTMEDIAHGEPLPIDGRFDRRLEVLLDEAVASGDYMDAGTREFDEMEREALTVAGKPENEKTHS
jgi:Arc/MetJ-type ribon-helix-helix transcriptional regulator